MSGGLPNGKLNNSMTFHFSHLIIPICASIVGMSCQEQVEHTAPAVFARDSADVMVSWGVNTLISDSGIIKYRVVSEKWEVNENKNPSKWTFDKGLFLEQFDEKFHIQAYIQCDTAYYYDKKKLWELRSRVRVKTKDGLTFTSEQLFWDEMAHELYSHVFSRLVTPDRTLQGTNFRSDDKMTHYLVNNSKGSFSRNDFTDNDNNGGMPGGQQDSLNQQRGRAVPERNN